MNIIETVNEAITRYLDKDGKEMTEEEFKEIQQSAEGMAQGVKGKNKAKDKTKGIDD